jgi:hypothetical protein
MPRSRGSRGRVEQGEGIAEGPIQIRGKKRAPCVVREEWSRGTIWRVDKLFETKKEGPGSLRVEGVNHERNAFIAKCRSVLVAFGWDRINQGNRSDCLKADLGTLQRVERMPLWDGVHFPC